MSVSDTGDGGASMAMGDVDGRCRVVEAKRQTAAPTAGR